MAFVLLFLFTFLLFLVLFRKVLTSSVVAGCDAIFYVDDDSSGEPSKSPEVHCCYWKLQHPQEGQLYQKHMLP
jgi:hypothetical protein